MNLRERLKALVEEMESEALRLRDVRNYSGSVIGPWARKLAAILAESESDPQQKILNCDCQCGGTGLIGVAVSRAEHACGGDERSCARICPVEVEACETRPCECACHSAGRLERLLTTKAPLGLERRELPTSISLALASENEAERAMWQLCGGPRGDRWRMTVLASIDHGALHVSIAHSHRYPTWGEIKAVRAWAWDEDTEVVMVLRRRDYVNVHPNCFHLWTSACGREGR